MPSWLPWRFIARYVARSRGFIDPVSVYARVQQFAQPAEVAEPVELLRAGIVFHARGMLNSKVIQHNLDWVWPYWVERQFDPSDASFLPRAFSITHVNLTHRNWSAIGLPDVDALPIVDPRGLLTPLWDGWSLDAWLITDKGAALLPSRAVQFEQIMTNQPSLSIRSSTGSDGMHLDTITAVQSMDNRAVCTFDASGLLDQDGWLVISARPYNPEGVSLINDIELVNQRRQWNINGTHSVIFDRPIERHHTADYHAADVYIHLLEKQDELKGHCPLGMATAAAMFRMRAGQRTSIKVQVPLHINAQAPDAMQTANNDSSEELWQRSLAEAARLSIPDPLFQKLYDSALRTLILCSPGDVYAGPYTYKRYWYRDAVFICQGLLSAGLLSRVESIVKRFPERQSHNGYFHSQEGEWDSNGQVLWMLDRYYRFAGLKPDATLWRSIDKGAHWIVRKRMPEICGPGLGGLLPAGFSAEHLGPNDYYYWDDFWGIAGLTAAASLAEREGSVDKARQFTEEAASFHSSLGRSLTHAQAKLRTPAIPAAPTRRMDAGAIGSIVASYPLQLVPHDDERLLGTLEFLLQHCFYKDGFFQDMIHSGTNAYLTLQVAQCLLRAGDARYASLMQRIAKLATPTGHWPEAIHPNTDGGCMGDGHHAWAAAEWVAMIRYCFVREESEKLILGSGIQQHWITSNQPVSFGPVATSHGQITVFIDSLDDKGSRCECRWQAHWHTEAPELIVAVPGYESVSINGQQSSVVINILASEVDTAPAENPDQQHADTES